MEIVFNDRAAPITESIRGTGTMIERVGAEFILHSKIKPSIGEGYSALRFGTLSMLLNHVRKNSVELADAIADYQTRRFLHHAGDFIIRGVHIGSTKTLGVYLLPNGNIGTYDHEEGELTEYHGTELVPASVTIVLMRAGIVKGTVPTFTLGAW